MAAFMSSSDTTCHICLENQAQITVCDHNNCFSNQKILFLYRALVLMGPSIFQRQWGCNRFHNRRF